MGHGRKAALVSLILVISGALSAAHAWWPVNGTCVWTSAEDNIPGFITSDSLGGSIIAWTNSDIYGHYGNLRLQRLTVGGSLHWGPNGVVPPGGDRYNGGARLAPSGSGGVFVAWVGTYPQIRTLVYASLVRANGTTVSLPMYRSPGYPECLQAQPSIVPDGSGGAIIAYEQDMEAGGYWDIYAQRFDGVGNALWISTGVAVRAAPGYQTGPALVSDGAGGAIIAWNDTDGIRAQRIDADGVLLWGAAGTLVCGVTASLGFLQSVPDGVSGAILAWQDARTGTVESYAQRVNNGGVALWGANGISLCSASGSQCDPALVADNDHGAVIAWRDFRSGAADLYAQRIDSVGTPLWTANGVAVCTATGDQASMTIATDGAGGAIVAWTDSRGGAYDVYTQRVDADGATRWGTDGSVVCSAPGTQNYVVLTSDGAGGAVAGWRDERRAAPFESDVYAILISEGMPPVATLLQNMSVEAVGGGILVEWTLSEAPDGIGFAVSRAEGLSSLFAEIPEAGILRDGLTFSFRDDRCTPGGVYRYRVEIVGGSERRTLFETKPIVARASELILRQNRPNPFNPSTTIEYSLPERCHVTLDVYSAAGRFVTRLVDEEQAPGNHRASWNGTDASGAAVASGAYFARLRAGSGFKTSKLILMR